MAINFLYSVENRLIVECVLASLKGAHINWSSFQDPAQINWNKLLQQAMQHEVIGSVYRALVDQSEVVVPPAIL